MPTTAWWEDEGDDEGDDADLLDDEGRLSLDLVEIDVGARDDWSPSAVVEATPGEFYHLAGIEPVYSEKRFLWWRWAVLDGYILTYLPACGED